jgi:hypothetical protein
MARPAGQKVLEEAKVLSQQRFGLKDLLNVPMQRILKYPLLLRVCKPAFLLTFDLIEGID